MNLLGPSRRWFIGGALLAIVGLLGFVRADALSWLLLLDAMWVLALLVDAWLVPAPAALRMERVSPPAFSVGRALPVSVIWRQGGSRPLRVIVRERFPEPLGGADTPERRFVIPAGGLAEETLRILPRARGKGAGGSVTARVVGPLGLVWRQGTVPAEPWQVTVYPRLEGASIRSLPAQAARRREAGRRSVRRIGEGRVFETLREWVPGDDTRTIDWKATARRGKVMARQYEDERRQPVMLVLDAGRLMTAEIDGVPRLESAIDAALHLAYSVVEHDDDVGLMIFADEVQVFLPPGRGRRALRAVLDGLAAAEGRLIEPNYPAALSYLAARNRKRALTVLFTDLIDRTASDALVTRSGSLRRRHLPVAVTLRDPALEQLGSRRPATVPEAYQRAAAEELLLAREEALAEMRRRGVITLDVPPRRAAAAVVEQYTRLKRRGVL
ncbi:MAG: DUF58 domain-containing protein [Gemmatimonadales bacterium]